MRYTKEGWAAIGIHNSWGIMHDGQGPVMIRYIPRESTHSARWRMEYPNHAYRDYLTASSNYSGRPTKSSKLLALNHAKGAIPDVTAWECDVWGGWHPAGTMERAMSAAKAKVEQPL